MKKHSSSGRADAEALRVEAGGYDARAAAAPARATNHARAAAAKKGCEVSLDAESLKAAAARARLDAELKETKSDRPEWVRITESIFDLVVVGQVYRIEKWHEVDPERPWIRGNNGNLWVFARPGVSKEDDPSSPRWVPVEVLPKR